MLTLYIVPVSELMRGRGIKPLQVCLVLRLGEFVDSVKKNVKVLVNSVCLSQRTHALPL